VIMLLDRVAVHDRAMPTESVAVAVARNVAEFENHR